MAFRNITFLKRHLKFLYGKPPRFAVYFIQNNTKISPVIIVFKKPGQISVKKKS